MKLMTLKIRYTTIIAVAIIFRIFPVSPWSIPFEYIKPIHRAKSPHYANPANE